MTMTKEGLVNHSYKHLTVDEAQHAQRDHLAWYTFVHLQSPGPQGKRTTHFMVSLESWLEAVRRNKGRRP